MIRHPAVAGQFYPGNQQELRASLDEYCQSVLQKKHALGIISPHAGYIYSGAIAGKLFSQIEVPDRVILIGPNHRGVGHSAALYDMGDWETPLGTIGVDRDLAGEININCSYLASDDKAHRYEHSLEVQVPFIQHENPSAQLVPICIGHLPLDALVETGEALADVISAAEQQVLIVASSDMTHFEPGDVARNKDTLALDCAEALDPEGLYKVVRDNRISMCGVLPSVIMLAAARKLGATHGEVVAYGNSGDVTGDQSDVVGYASVIVS